MVKLKKTEKKESERAKVEDIEKIVVDLAKKGKTPSQIGIILRDEHGIPKAKILGKKISKILKENKVEYADDVELVSKKLKNIEEHVKKNNNDKRAKREVVRFVALKKSLQSYKERKNSK
jgi:ribosomal protein S15P/S13E